RDLNRLHLERNMKRVLGIVAAVGIAAAVSLAVAQPANATGNSSEGVGSTVIGFDYVDANSGGAVLTSWGSRNCTGPIDDLDARFSSMPGGWNDIISSTQSAAICWQKLWEHINQGGAALGFQGTTGYVGDAMNDRTSSIDFS